MLSVFPSLLSWTMLSPLIIRLALAAAIMYPAYILLRGRGETKPFGSSAKPVAALELLFGILLIVGLWTQVAALVIAIDLIVRLAFKIRDRKFLTDGINYYLILLILSLSLLVTGAGFCAFDLPL